MAIEQAGGSLIAEGVTKRYGRAVALDGIDLSLAAGEFLTLLGPSGCGKTTLLRCIAGLVRPDAGRISAGGRSLDDIPPWQRDIGVVFQSYALFPHMSVAANVGFGLKMRRIARAEFNTRVEEALAMVDMTPFATRYPSELSGGQRQRVALARALVIRPTMLLLDEPLAALDARLRTAVQIEIRQLQRRLGITTLLVTHDQSEAMAMSDRIAVMRKGRIEQIADSRTIYARPATPFVADFIGEINRIDGEVRREGPSSIFIRDGWRLPVADVAPGPAVAMIRPEAIRLAPVGAPDTAESPLRGEVTDVVPLGDRILILVRTSFGVIRATQMAPETPVRPGDRVIPSWAESDILIFPDR